MLRDWLRATEVYLEPRVVVVLLLGFASGLPLLLTLSTLTFWLAEAQVDKAAIGLFALAGLPYTWKFAWSPVIDRVPLPLLTRALGRRRGWLLFVQILLALAIVGLGACDPRADLGRMALFAVLVAFLSASQDIVIDAYRVELLEERQQGAGAAMVVIGYRVAMLLAGAGALLIAAYAGWFWAYAAMAACLGIGMVTVLLAPEPDAPLPARGGGAAVCGRREPRPHARPEVEGGGHHLAREVVEVPGDLVLVHGSSFSWWTVGRSKARSLVRAALRRDLTVPGGQSSRAAIADSSRLR